MIRKNNFLTCTAALAFGMAALLPAQPALATAAFAESYSVSSYTEIPEHEATQAIESLKEEILKGNVKVHTETANFDWDNAYVGELDGKNVVTVPLLNVGDGWSNFTAYYSEDQTIEDYTEGYFKQLSEDSGSVKIFLNGMLATDGVFKDSDAPSTPENSGRATSVMGVKDAIAELNSCLSAAGIPAWLVAGAAALCSTTGWAGILACYAGAGIAGGTVGYCVGKASQKL